MRVVTAYWQVGFLFDDDATIKVSQIKALESIAKKYEVGFDMYIQRWKFGIAEEDIGKLVIEYGKNLLDDTKSKAAIEEYINEFKDFNANIDKEVKEILGIEPRKRIELYPNEKYYKKGKKRGK